MSKRGPQDAESKRLVEDAKRRKNWKRWGPYLAERQWGTVREDYSADGSSWTYFPHEHARSRAYRWGEDGLLGICDRQCRLCFALALWNGRDPILKERLFGLTGPEGNHGEDVKEQYFYLDSTPTHSYMKALYKYPQAEFPYAQLVAESARRSRRQREYELEDTGVFDENRYFDVTAEYAKAGPDDVLICISVTNRGPERATLHLLPTVWFRNTWIWGCAHEGCETKPHMALVEGATVQMDHATLGRFYLAAGFGPNRAAPRMLFTENHTNDARLFNVDHYGYTKDAFHDYLIDGQADRVNPAQQGTKAAAHYELDLKPTQSATIRLRLYSQADAQKHPLGPGFRKTFEQRQQEADTYYAHRIPAEFDDQQRAVARQAYAGLLWTKQFYHYVVKDWLDGDPLMPTPPPQRHHGRNHDWPHLFNRDVISMPDKWEYPWYAAWDLAFHMLPMSRVDADFAKRQLILFLREWYMHPNGQLPAYEFALGDVNPPVHAWAAWRVYKMTAPRGKRDRNFLERAFQKLLMNFTWWVNRKDLEGNHIFAGGFLGLDNIGVFDRSQPLPTGGYLNQADGTAWMAFYCSTMLSMSLELARDSHAYGDMASKFFEHFVAIADAMNNLGGTGLWDEQDGFYYDQLTCDHHNVPLRVRSLVGLMPLIAVEVFDQDLLDSLPAFQKRTQWFIENRRDLAQQLSYFERTEDEQGNVKHLLAIPSRERLSRVMRYLLDESEFLSPFGIRSLSRVHLDRPYIFQSDGYREEVRYVSGESESGMFGGNSNWRGPIWFPINFLLIEALEKYHYFYGDDLTFECPTGSGNMKTLGEIADEIARRLSRLFLPDADGRRPCHGDDERFAEDEHFRDYPLFYEYFDGDTGRGLGASHQTGWTALVTRCMEKYVLSACGKRGVHHHDERHR